MAWRFTANRYLQEWDGCRHRDWWPGFSFKGKAHITAQLNRPVSVRALRGSNWDVFHPTYYDPYFLRHLHGRPFVLTIHDMTHELYPEGLSDRKTTPRRKALLASRASRIIAVSENTRTDVIRLLGVPPEKVVTVLHGNSLKPGALEPRVPALGKPYWLYVGARQNYKNWDLLVRALGARANQSDYLVMVGGGALSPSEIQALGQAGLSGRFHQTGASEAELAGWYSGARGLVYPSLYEGFGMPLVEAMSWGCPVVAAQASCLPEIGGEAALYFDPRSVDDLMGTLSRMEDPQVRTRLIDAGRGRSQRFTWESAAEKTMQTYQESL
jgi:glycosyltransferase involved in cell wall biosynthesis